MNRRFYGCVAVAALLVALTAGCGTREQPLPSPHEVTDTTVSVLDGMSLNDYPGPKAQIVYADGQADFFCDTLGLFSVFLRPEHDRKIGAMYVQDMASTDWRHPVGHWIDAKQAYYIVGSKQLGAMGQTFASFAKEDDARRFMQAEGGKLYRFDGISIDMATTDGGVVKDQNM